MTTDRLYMLLLGCKPQGRFTEQHDIFFGMGSSLKDLLPDIKQSWPGPHTIHIDAWREVTEVNGYQIQLLEKQANEIAPMRANRLFFINLGGYKENEFEEYHYKMLVVAKDKSTAIHEAKQTAFYKHTHFPGATSHIDDKYGVDVDDLYEIEDILPSALKEKYFIRISVAENLPEDAWHLGYTKLSSLV